MKNIENKDERRFGLKRVIGIFVLAFVTVFAAYAQNSLPAPGSGGSYNPAPIGGGPGPMGPGPGWGGPGPGWGGGMMGPGWYGGMMGPGWDYSPTIIVNTPNRGTDNVIACGYDASGVWQRIPLHVKFYYNGYDYDVTVVNAWNPWTQTWMRNINQPAYNTSYYIRGNTYDYYVPLSTGTYYFNL